MITHRQIIDDAPEMVAIPPTLRHQRIEIVFRSYPSFPEPAEGQPVPSFFDMTREDCGAIKGGPDDVSCNPEYLTGFGE